MKKPRKIMIGLTVLMNTIAAVLTNKGFQLFTFQLESRTEDRIIYSLWFLVGLFGWLIGKVGRVDQSWKELMVRVLNVILNAFVILITIAFLILLQNWLGYRMVEFELEVQTEKYALFWLTGILFILGGLSNKLEWDYEKRVNCNEKSRI